ncbi:MAG: hypothetical protein CME71_03355 [Halobacteriovorax sp.]|nr:hypothetical protein [Halobacteriovorax sp.]
MKFALLLILFSSQALAMRVVSTSPAISEMVSRLGAEKYLVGVTPYCLDGLNASKVGTALQLDFEKVVSLKPDLIILQENSPGKTSAVLSKLGLKTLVVKIVTLDDLFASWKKIASHLKLDSAQIEKLKKEIIPTKTIRRVLFKLGGAPEQSAMIAGVDSFYADLATSLGSIYATKSKGWPNLSAEELITLIDSDTTIIEVATHQDRLWSSAQWKKFCPKCTVLSWVDARAAYPGPSMVSSIVKLYQKHGEPQ